MNNWKNSKNWKIEMKKKGGIASYITFNDNGGVAPTTLHSLTMVCRLIR